MPRPSWIAAADLQQEGIYLGFTRGQWPVQAFASRTQAARWASESATNETRCIIGPVPIPDDAPCLVGLKTPVVYDLVEME